MIKLKKKDDELLSQLDNIKTGKDEPGKAGQNKKSEKDSAYKARDSGEDNNYETAANRSMLNGLTDGIIVDLKKKSRTRFWIMWGMTVYFVVITYLVFKIVFSWQYSDYLKSILLGGFFANLVGLIAIIFKYVFSQSKELYDFWIGIRDGIYHKDHKE